MLCHGVKHIIPDKKGTNESEVPLAFCAGLSL